MKEDPSVLSVGLRDGSGLENSGKRGSLDRQTRYRMDIQEDREEMIFVGLRNKWQGMILVEAEERIKSNLSILYLSTQALMFQDAPPDRG